MNIKKTSPYRLARKIYRSFFKKNIQIIIDEDEKSRCLDFYKNYYGFRTINNCVLNTGVSEDRARYIKEVLYKERAIGYYYFEENVPPHVYMRDLIKERIGDKLNHKSYILEIGPGENPIFPFPEYENWYGIDKNYDGNIIRFNNHLWAYKKYPSKRIFEGSWENISQIRQLESFHNKFDFVVASHSYEHVSKPIQSLIEASIMLKSGGYIILFVPDGFSDDPNSRNEMTHTLFLVPDMIEEFFIYSKKYKKPIIQSFRPNADYFVIAQKL